MGLLGHALRAQQWLHHRAFEGATAAPEEAQARILRGLLRDNADTIFGREHRFAAIESAAEFAQRVPIRDYEALRPYVGRIMAGERQVLTAEAPFMFTTTSGTTGEPKFIPVTAGWTRSMAALMRLWTFYALRDHPGMLDQRVLTIVGPAIEGVATGAPAVRRDDRIDVSAAAVARPPAPRAAVRRRADPRSREPLLHGTASGARPRAGLDRHAQSEHRAEARGHRGAARRRSPARRSRRHARGGRARADSLGGHDRSRAARGADGSAAFRPQAGGLARGGPQAPGPTRAGRLLARAVPGRVLARRERRGSRRAISTRNSARRSPGAISGSSPARGALRFPSKTTPRRGSSRSTRASTSSSPRRTWPIRRLARSCATSSPKDAATT